MIYLQSLKLNWNMRIPYCKVVPMKRILSYFILLMAVSFTANAQSSLIEQEKEAEALQEFDNELRSPMVGPKLRAYIRAYMKSIAEELYRQGYEVETMREGEVVITVIPTDKLFAPNDTVLMPSASASLEHFRQYAQPDDRFKIVVTVHSDDTGSEDYLYALTERRTVAILDYLEANGFNPDNLVGFPKGSSSPVAESTSRANRAKNRRLEMFIVPSQELLTQARQSSKK